MNRDQAADHIRRTIFESKRLQRDWAKEIGVSSAYLSMISMARKKPSDRVLAAFGLERVEQPEVYRRMKRMTAAKEAENG